MRNSLDSLGINPDNKIVDRVPSFFSKSPSAAFSLPATRPFTMQLEQTQEAWQSLEYDMLLENAERKEITAYPPHPENMVEQRDRNGDVVPGCFVTQAADVHQ